MACTSAELLKMVPPSGRLADLARGSHGRSTAVKHGAFLTALCLRTVLEGETPSTALSQWCASPCACSSQRAAVLYAHIKRTWPCWTSES